MANYHVEIQDASRARMSDLVRVHNLAVLPQTLRRTGGVYSVAAVASPEQIEQLTTAGYQLARYEDVDAEPVPRLQVDAQEAAGAAYLTVDQVEQALTDIVANNAGITEIVGVPYPTYEGRTPRALHIRSAGENKPTVLFIGGVHAREWGSPDILINFVRQLTDAYRNGTGITDGAYSCTSANVRQVVSLLDIVIYPQANPDGRNHSMTADPMWRKNRRPASAGDAACVVGGGNGPGVDINRNYDFLWDFTAKFSPKASVQTSTDPCREVFYGPSAASEPETRNVVWLMDNWSALGYFIDIHSFGEDILYSWGDDDGQSADPSMNFANAAYDTKRGVLDSAPGGDPEKYQEYLPATDQAAMIALGQVMKSAIQKSHGRQYTLKSAANLYPTSGTSDDYAYSRKFIDPTKGTVYSYTIEWGPQRLTIPASFHPDYSDMEPIIDEVTAALIAFCVAIAQQLAPPPPQVTAINPASGDEAGGTAVTITGSGFTGATDVGFGVTSAAAMSVDSDTQITATSPAGTATVDITVITPAGTSPTSPADQFTYNPPNR